MSLPSPDFQFRAVSMALVGQGDERHVGLHIVAADGATVAIQCDRNALLDIQQIARDLPGTVLANAVDDRVHGAPVTSDVTERIKAQRENVESRRIFEDLFDNSDAAIIDQDFSVLFRFLQQLKRDGVRNLRGYIAESDERLPRLVGLVGVNNANAAALKMLGAPSLQDIATKQLTNIIDIAEAIFQNETSIRRSEYLVTGGTPIPVVYSLRIPKTEEEARRVPIVIMDLSDIRLAEAARQATVAKSQFLSSMSHEIRTPLNGVIGNLELLALTPLDNEQFELIDDADKAAKALLGLVGNILDFSKIEAGKLTVEVGDINPAALVEEAVDVLQSLARQKKIFVAATFGSDVPSLVRGDAMRIRQILLNLVGNAVKFTEQGGVQVSLTMTSSDPDLCELRFDVHDSGRGFDPLLGNRLFEPFTQDRNAVDGSEGTGLGLSICKSLVEAFDGTIGCEGVPGEGATFGSTVPTTVVRRAPPVGRPDLSGIKVMLIGQDDSTTASLGAYFTIRGAEVVRDAWQAGVAADVAVVVSDGSEDVSDTARRLRDRGIVPLLFGVGQSPRIRLRQGFAAVIPPDASAAHLDRNIRLLVGHAQARDRLAAQQAAVVSAFGPSLKGARILVLEDRLINQTVIQKQLKKLGIECELAFNGIGGFKMLESQRFDLILCDCSMPEMNGYDFTRTLRTREATAGIGYRVPVIALTANAFREDADKCFEAGMDDFISKPVTMDRLAAMLVRWLSPSPLSSAMDHPRTQPTGAPPIDMAVLAEILGTAESALLDEVLAEFLAVAATSLADVAAAVSSNDPARIRAMAHGAKGEARCAAAIGLAEFYAALDHRAEAGDQAASRELVAQAAAELHRIETFIQDRASARS
jgi:signal transduction histidine kinase/CheY-like chemotaxis protein